MILNHLSGVKQTSPHSWMARCPAHEDRTASLSVREADDGRILLHCFAGCEAHDIAGAVGLTMTDLFPRPLYHRAKPLRMRIPAIDALRALSREAGVVAIAAADIADGKTLNAEDASRVAVAAGRIATALEVVHG